MTPPRRIAFAGTPQFARAALAALIEAGFEIALVLTQPDRPAGRGKMVAFSPVKELALAHGLPLHQPERLRDAAALAPLAATSPDVLVVAAYGLILPQAVLDWPRNGCLNIHASLLPRWRGAAPIQRAIEAGDRETGITIMRMDAGLDTGPMLLRRSLPIDDTDTTGSLQLKLATLGATSIIEALRTLPSLEALPQPDEGVCYAAKLEKREAEANWLAPAALLARRLRAFDPWPGLQTTLAGLTLKLWRGQAVAGHGAPGEVIAVESDSIVVACGKGALRLTEVQRPGGRRLPVAEFLRGQPVSVGAHCR